MQPNIQAFFDPVTWTVSYVVFDKPGGHCAIIDPVLDYDPKSGRTKHHSADVLIKFVHSKELTVDWILETHAHADHLSSAHYLQQELGGKVAIGSRISGVQQVFKKLFNMGPDFQPDGSQFDHLFDDGDTFEVGELKGRAILCLDIHRLIWPTSSGMRFLSAIRCSCRMWERPVLISWRDARQLYRSIRKLLDQYPPETRLFMCHDYPPGDRPIQWESTVAEQRAHNIHVHDGINEDGFVAMRTARDATLEMPVLILPSVQVNVRAGQMPPAEDNGRVYLKIPINVL